MSLNIPSQSSTLDDWLTYLERIHPATIEMGLDRVKQVADQINLLKSDSKIILIGGTNGKGTTARFLESMLLAQGYSVGTYASPHLVRYNERVRVNGNELDDQIHVDAFHLLEQGRGATSLTYFEYGTLGALAIFKRFAVDYVLLEVGLGGRYDATNIVTPFASVITTVDLDHKEYLGDTRELVAYDKAGIFRPNTPAIVGDLNIPHTMTDYGNEINADMVLSKTDFHFTQDQTSFRWQYEALDYRFDLPAIPAQNAATALTVLKKLGLLPSEEKIATCLSNLVVEGRFQKLVSDKEIYADVAHNPESARYLVQKLALFKSKGFKVHALSAMLCDKDQSAVFATVNESVDSWHLASLSCPRGESAENLLSHFPKETEVSQCFDSVHQGLDTLTQALEDDDMLIIFGSFFTVADAITYFKR